MVGTNQKLGRKEQAAHRLSLYFAAIARGEPYFYEQGHDPESDLQVLREAVGQVPLNDYTAFLARECATTCLGMGYGT